MSECDFMRESMPLLLTESLDPARRELTHQHIESCAVCTDEWAAYQETWNVLDELPLVEPPARLKEKFLADLYPPAAANVIPFHRKPAFKWLAQAAAVVVIAGGGYFAGHRGTAPTFTATRDGGSVIQPAGLASKAIPVSYSIAESRALPASAISPDIEGRPDIQNVQFIDTNPNDPEIAVSFDLTSHVTVTGTPTDKSMVRLLTYVLENEDHLSPSRQRAIDWVRATYSRPSNADPEIATALANVLRNDEHEGVRIKAVDTLKNLPANVSTDSDTHQALIDALKNDPNPAVRIKAVEALANLAKNGTALGGDALDILRQKASQGDENPYVRVKAAEALQLIHP
jgi:HEAT repeats